MKKQSRKGIKLIHGTRRSIKRKIRKKNKEIVEVVGG